MLQNALFWGTLLLEHGACVADSGRLFPDNPGNDAEPTLYSRSRVTRIYGAMICVATLLIGGLCELLVVTFVYLGANSSNKGSFTEAAGNIVGAEILLLLGVAILLWLFPLGLGLLRWKVLVWNDCLKFQGPFRMRAFKRTELSLAVVRGLPLGRKALRIRPVGGQRGGFWVPLPLVDGELQRWLESSGELRVPPPSDWVGDMAGSDTESGASAPSLQQICVAELAERVQGAWLTPVIIALNALAFVVTIGLAEGGKITPSALLQVGANAGIYSLRGDWWRLWTSTFIHVSFLHVAVNMLALWQGGRMIEALYGRSRFAILYLTTGGFASLVSSLSHPQLVCAGASGAIFGIYGSLLAFSWHRDGYISGAAFKPIRQSAIMFCLFNLAYGFTDAGVDNAAHLGGLVGGLLMGSLLFRPILVGGPVPEPWLRPIGVTLSALYVILSLPLISESVLPSHPGSPIGANDAPKSRSTPAATPQSGVSERRPMLVEYHRGINAPSDPIQARDWFANAAGRGDVGAQFALGEMYEAGDGIPASPSDAVIWYTKAAEQGDSRSQDRLARLYEAGKGVPVDKRQALKWYLKAAEQGEVLDEFKLGEIYAAGTDVPKDLVAARKWYQKAADQGFSAATYQLQKVSDEENGLALLSHHEEKRH